MVAIGCSICRTMVVRCPRVGVYKKQAIVGLNGLKTDACRHSIMLSIPVSRDHQNHRFRVRSGWNRRRPTDAKKLARISAGTRANSTAGPGQISTLKNCSSEKTERKMEKGLGIGHDCEKWSTYLLTSMKLDHSDEATESNWESRGGIMG